MQAVNFPYAIKKIDGVKHTKLVTDFPGQPDGFVEFGPEKWIMPAKFERFADQIYNLEVRPDDVWICTLPRSGTTWTQEMIWLICNNLDYEAAAKTSLDSKFPYLEYNTLMSEPTLKKMHDVLDEVAFNSFKSDFEPCYDTVNKNTSKRFIKTHLPMKVMPRGIMEVGAKVVYVARNPKDMAVSWYHMHKSFPGMDFGGDFESFLEYFLNDLTMYTPYWKHVLDGWENRHRDNVYFMFYEELKSDLALSLKKLAIFLGYPLKDEDLPRLMNHLSFENTKKNPTINYKLSPLEKANNFIRRGEVGGNPEMTEELSKKFDEWTEKNLAGSDFKSPCNF